MRLAVSSSDRLMWDENKTIIGLKYFITGGSLNNIKDENKTIIGLKFH